MWHGVRPCSLHVRAPDDTAGLPSGAVQEQRIIHVVIPLPHKVPLHIINVYGYSGSSSSAMLRARTAALLAAAMERAAALGAVPVIILGDLNVNPDVFEEEGWYGAAWLQAARDGLAPRPTFLAPNEGTRIDFAWLNASPACAFEACEVGSGTDHAPH